MKKYGFTIAESIITMAIIGIVAALTIPSLTTNYRKQAYTSALSSAISNFENAMSTLILNEGADDLLDTQAWKNAELSLDSTSTEEKINQFTTNIGKTLKISNFKTSSLNYKPLSAPNSNASLSYGSPVRFTTKNGYEYQIYLSNISKIGVYDTEEDMINDGCSYFNKAGEVGIDINGEKGPNIVGRDYFRFELGNDGRLYPFGGNDYCAHNDVEYTDVTTKCVTDLDGSYCAAHLMQNGYKMDY